MLETLTHTESPWQTARGLARQLRDAAPDPDTLQRLLELRGQTHVLTHATFPVDLFNAAVLERLPQAHARAWEDAARALQEAR